MPINIIICVTDFTTHYGFQFHYTKVIANVLFLIRSHDKVFILMFFLTAILCPDLDNVANGQVRLTGNTVGSGAIYSCSPGYTLEGFQQRRCNGDGDWEGTPPTCHLTTSCKCFVDDPHTHLQLLRVSSVKNSIS